MSVDKMREEKIEHRGGSEQLEAGFVEGNEKLARRLLFKMDVRYVPFTHLSSQKLFV